MSQPFKPSWLIEAEKHIGKKEYPGAANNPWIVLLWQKIKRGGIKSDAVPWCAAFVGGCLETVGIVSSRYESAASYLKWGTPISTPVTGCIVVFARDGGGHVGFVMGMDDKQRLLVLGGNQGDKVSVAPFEQFRVVGYRWPLLVPIHIEPLPVYANGQPSSTNEA